MIIAVDGPAASGKGTIARALARHYRLPFLDTGLLYRAAALNLIRMGGDAESEFAATRACDISHISFDDPELKSETVGGFAARISPYPMVRHALLERQKRFADQPGGAVLDGRDIGTIIAPDADAKLFVTASSEVRAHRRYGELKALGLNVHLDDVIEDIKLRDSRDRGRKSAPLRMAPDAILLDTSTLSITGAIKRAISAVDAKLATHTPGAR